MRGMPPFKVKSRNYDCVALCQNPYFLGSLSPRNMIDLMSSGSGPMNKRINSWFLDPVDDSSIDNTAAENVSVSESKLLDDAAYQK